MDAFNLDRFRLSHPGRWALGISLGAHGLFGLAALVLAPGFDLRPADGPLPIDACVLAADTKLSVTFTESSGPEPPSAPGPSSPDSDPSPPVVYPIRVTHVPTQGPAGSGPSTASGGPAGVASFFGVPARGQSVVYAIDRSVSMGLTGALETARRELLACLDRLPSTARFQVVCYNRRAEPLTLGGQTGLAAATTENKQQAAAFLESLRAEGSTNHLPALQQALALEPDEIFLVTDADDLTPEQVRDVTRQNRRATVIHTIDLSRQPRREDGPLCRLARANRGTYRPLVPGP